MLMAWARPGDRPQRRAFAAQAAAVDHVVVHQREGVDQLDGGRRRRGRLGLAPDQLRREQQRDGAQHLPAGVDRGLAGGILPAEVIADPAVESGRPRADDVAHLRLGQGAVAPGALCEGGRRPVGRAHAGSSTDPRRPPSGERAGASSSLDSSAASTACREKSRGR